MRWACISTARHACMVGLVKTRQDYMAADKTVLQICDMLEFGLVAFIHARMKESSIEIK